MFSFIQYINALPCSSNKKTKTIKTHQLISYFLNWAFMGPFASELFSNFGSINTHTYIYPVSEKLTSSPKPVGLETVYFGLNFIITIWLLIIIHYHSLFEKNWYLLSHWPIKLQHELFSPRKVHVRMHKSLVYEIDFNGRGELPFYKQ